MSPACATTRVAASRLLRHGLVAGLAALAACRDDPLSPREWRDLASAEARWQAARPPDYAYELRIGCFCTNALPVFTRLEIRNDTVAAATPLDPPPWAPSVPLAQWLTVPQLFARLRSAAATGAGGAITDVSASYDPVYGYPTRIAIRCAADVTDCGELTEARHLQPIP